MQIKNYILVLFITGLSLAKSPTPISPSIAKVQSSWTKTKSYQATFKQTIQSKRMGDTEISTGEVAIQKPGRIRWDVKSEGKVQILNGKKLIHIHIPARRKANIVDIYENITKDLDTRSLSFLSGNEEFKGTYDISIIKESGSFVQLKLVPKDASTAASYIAEFDKSSYLLRSLATDSADSTVKTEFTDVKTNISFDPGVFDYKPGPKDVVTVNK